jgi:hypothetical protein
MENTSRMGWSWPFNSRNGDHRDGDDHNGQGLNGFTGDPYPDFLCVGAQKPEPRGFIGNWNRIQISGCLR